MHCDWAGRNEAWHRRLLLRRATAMAAMDASWYLNHSYDAPNVRAVPPDDHGGFTSYCTSRPVRAGDELFLDYRLDLPSLYTKIENERRQWQ